MCDRCLPASLFAEAFATLTDKERAFHDAITDSIIAEMDKHERPYVPWLESEDGPRIVVYGLGPNQ